jgi:uncharacterized protein (UPF0335 family)
MTDGYRQNTVSSEVLRGFIERIEALREQKASLADGEKCVFAEAKAGGFVAASIRYVLKARAMKPSDYQEAQALADMYMSALGMAPEPPLFRAANLMAVDTAAREQYIEALKKFVPNNGSIIVEAGARPVRLTRAANGEVSVSEIVESPAPAAASSSPLSRPGAAKKDVPDVLPAEAEELGRLAALADVAIIKNPFPFGDDRRARWDLGWRRGSGSDGMGPQ